MKIVIMTDSNHPGTLGGIQTFNRILKKIFPKELITLAPRTKQKKFYKIDDVIEYGSSGIIYKIINKLTNRKLDNYIIKRNLKKINPDICILSTPRELKNLKGIKCKKILVQHTNFDNYMKVHYKNNQNLIEKSKKELDYFVFLSKNDMKRFQKELNFPQQKSIIINHTCEVEQFKDLKKRNKILIMVGRIVNRTKRYDLVILAMKKLKDFTLLIYGDGPDLKKLKKLVNKEKMENVIFRGPTNNIAKALDETSIFIMASDYEGYPLVTIEAIRRGLPIILRDTFEAARDIVVNNRNGILLNKSWDETEFINSVYRVFKDYDYYTKNTLELQKKYEFNEIKKNWNNLFEKLLKDKIENN